MDVVTGVVAFLRVLPQLFSIIAKLGEFLSDSRTKAMLTDLEKTIDQLQEAKTTNERLQHTKSLMDLFGRLRG